VVESDEWLGGKGDAAHECLMGRFTDMLVRELGCEVSDTLDGVLCECCDAGGVLGSLSKNF
jgi:hypothetical protein